MTNISGLILSDKIVEKKVNILRQTWLLVCQYLSPFITKLSRFSRLYICWGYSEKVDTIPGGKNKKAVVIYKLIEKFFSWILIQKKNITISSTSSFKYLIYLIFLPREKTYKDSRQKLHLCRK